MVDSLRTPDSHNSASPDRLSEDTDLQTLLSAILGESLPGQAGEPTPSARNVVDLASHRASESAAMSTDARHAERGSREEETERSSRAPVPFVPRKRKRDSRATTQNGVWKTVEQSTSVAQRGADNAASGNTAITAMSSAPMSVRAQTKEALFDTASIRPPDVDLESPVDVPLWRRPLVAGVTVAAIALVVWAGSRSTSPRPAGNVPAPSAPAQAAPSVSSDAATTGSTKAAAPSTAAPISAASTVAPSAASPAEKTNSSAALSGAPAARSNDQSGRASRGERTVRPASSRRVSRRASSTRRRPTATPARSGSEPASDGAPAPAASPEVSSATSSNP